jgi:hypothetical protein
VQTLLKLFCLLLFAFGYVHQRKYDFATPVSRLDLLHAMVTDGTLCIDRWHTNTVDKAASSGHFYSDKAPGPAVLALPAFALGAELLRLRGTDLESKPGWLATSWVASFFSQAMPAAAGAVAMFSWLGRAVSLRVALLTVLGLFLGGMPLPYSTALWSHSQVIGLLGVAVWAIDLLNLETKGLAKDVCCPPCSRKEVGLLLVGGFCTGLALASEYTAGFVVLGLFMWVLAHKRRSALWFVASALPALLLIPAYSWICFGTPFTLAYSYHATFPAMKNGLYAIEWPRLDILGRLLVSPERGLFYWSPFLLLMVSGYYKMAKTSPEHLWLICGVPLLTLVVISGRAWDWQAGNCIGPRYLCPILPLLALPCALGFERWPRLGLALLLLSFGLMSLATLTDATPPSGCNPLLDLHWPLMVEGEFSPNLGMAVGCGSYTSIALYYGVLISGSTYLWWRCSKEDRERHSSVGSRAIMEGR